MDDITLIRLQVDAAVEYINRTNTWYKLDLRSCRFWAKWVTNC